MSFELPHVSVIMPCYNQGQYVDEAVASVFAQTDQNFELIIINDGSTDGATIQRLKTYEQSSEQPKLTVIHTENQGPSAARNIGIQQAKGQYILPLDADDRIAPTFLEKAVPILDTHPTVGIVYTQAELFGEQSGRFDLPPYNFPDILLGNMIFNTSLYRKTDWEQAGGYNKNMVWGWEDYDFWLSILQLGREVVQIPEVLYFHREVANSRSQQMTQDDWVRSYAQIFRNHPTLYADHIEVLFQHLTALREDAQATHHRLRQTELRMFGIADSVQQSKFWQLRHRWCKLRQQLGFGVENIDPLLAPK
ncbi:MAG: glycosyltransferase family A protein [Leptolyngbyaceae cyanobacterium bins.302]|nr:glycosyltransferase family A protein [Leptolyngbyaceae cyanobacterium bins.302]